MIEPASSAPETLDEQPEKSNEDTPNQNKVEQAASPRRPLLRFYFGLAAILIAVVLMLALLRGIFGMHNIESLRTANPGEPLMGWRKGLRFDFAMAAGFATPLFVIYYLAGLWPARWSRILVVVYVAGVTLLSVLISLADMQYFDDSGKHLGYEATAYLNGAMWPIVLSAFQLRPWLTIFSVLGVVVATALAAMATWLLIKRMLPRRRMAWWRIAVVAAFYPALTWASSVFERGGFQDRALAAADSLVSTNPFINALCMSPVYAVFKISLRNDRNHPFVFYTEAENIRDVRKLYGIDDAQTSGAQKLDDKFPLLRQSPGVPGGNKHNVVIFLLESWSGKDIGALGSKAGVTPNFDALAKEGAFFDKFYATGVRTAEGLFSVLSSFPNQPLRPVIRTPVTIHNQWRTISQILHDAGYQSVFVHGRDMDFDGMRNILTYTAFDRIIDRRDFPKSFIESNDAWPGYADGDVMKRADDEFAEISKTGDKPFLGVILTMNTHPPFVTPDGFPLAYPPDSKDKSDTAEQKKFLNSLKYSDDTLKTFFNLAKKRDYFKNTIFVLVADHARGNDRFNLDSQHHIPMLIYAPGIVAPQVSHVTSGQLDIVPTLLGLLNLQTMHASWGRDLLHLPPGDEGFAPGIVGDEARWHAPHRLLDDPLGRNDPMLFNLDVDPECKIDIWSEHTPADEGMQHNLRAIVSLSQALLYQDRVYPRPEK